MRLASFHVDGRNRYGFSPDGIRLFDLGSLLRQRAAGEPTPNSLLEFIEAGNGMQHAAEALAAQNCVIPRAYCARAMRFDSLGVWRWRR